MVKIILGRRTKGAAVVVALTAVLAGLLVAGVSPAQAVPASSVPTVIVQPPGSGYWNRFNSVNPATHHIIWTADWATDFYMGAGMTVRTRAYPESQVGAVQYRIASVTNTCKAPNNAGKTVQVEFWYNGVLAGWAYYAHLDAVPVSAGQWVAHAAILGYTKRWTKSSCYDVTTDEGVHVHFELFTKGDGHYACWYARPAGTWVDYWGVIGRIGYNTPTSKRSCP
ncbi:hypothetical protein [Micromonospora sp. NPDC003816]|uniref:hypothetical protein n=1 Tax=Micromonospora sp. NPDC003816 TaxID=3364224 RepID=UPI00369B4988